MSNERTNNTADSPLSQLDVFFQEQLMELYFGEKQLLKAMQEMKEAASTEELEDAIAAHQKQTERHVKRLEKVFDNLDIPAAGKECRSLQALIEETRDAIKNTRKGSMTRDAAMIIMARKIEHYEIATYGGLVQLAITMGKKKIADLLDKTLREEGDTDHLLSKIAETNINIEADHEYDSRIEASMALA